ncbi:MULTISPECIES: gluconate 2-dehydrogenase subunit 3 family protein [unclassified Caballeronia]|uniref:gluconate 2-dehydrogenase subunit 3 family protein n=1 Tax=unclassified Caballeronia TaxID=2646786 RepID=UPI00285FBEBB|nr:MULTISPECIES: gluconate 2-dehydrogenase subunit 3 family protein [unclassified Caballeronia]MDR5815148.1 gluconate 2-dehydrogenase subunit 3 family protein [Caballeronia sp. LZ033]MDR5821617.1 gluconate 2-dehydrogenase subunit 3 family protein [Caballeronia sp. LZ043]MDR5879839.1 gluconate 2-dehydrogenase subunit 3 family protein [Caballeronia sp. LZ032]
MNLPRYPGYDVTDKRETPSWDEVTRGVIDERLATPKEPRFLDAVEWRALTALCARIVPQDHEREPAPLPALIDAKLVRDVGDGYRDARLPMLRDAWRIGLAALDAESRARHELPFASIDATGQHALLLDMQHGALHSDAWRGMPPALFFAMRVLHDICGAYYSHPRAWSEIGFGGPANPRGYVRMVFDRRDPWEAAEAKPGAEARALKENRRVR